MYNNRKITIAVARYKGSAALSRANIPDNKNHLFSWFSSENNSIMKAIKTALLKATLLFFWTEAYVDAQKLV